MRYFYRYSSVGGFKGEASREGGGDRVKLRPVGARR